MREMSLGPTSLLGGENPTGGTATVRWSLASLNGAFTTGPGALISLNVTATGGGGHTLAVAPGTWTTPYYISSPGAAFGVARIASHPTFTYIAQLSAPVGIFFQGLLHTATPYGGTLGSFLLSGTEVSRAAVPEPHTAALLALGLFGGAAGRTVWRRKQRRSS